MRADCTNDFHHKQSGSTLIVTLIILILVMLLGVTAMTTSDTQFKLTGNLQFEDLALNNAETAVSAGELGLANNPLATSYPQTAAPTVAALGDPLAITTWPASGYVIGYLSTNASPTAGVGLDCTDPGNAHNYDCVNTFLVTAQGTSGRGATKFVQTYYAVPLK
jgi:type II secretory pathway pseudopilin PulG